MIKSDLKLKLYAADVLVAESDDSGLWQKVLSAISAAEDTPIGESGAAPSVIDQIPRLNFGTGPGDPFPEHITEFAQKLGVTAEQVIGACSPTNDSPFVHIDHHCWESLKKNNPQRGPGSVAPIVLAGTLLSIWFDVQKQGPPNMVQAVETLATINLREKNARRSIQNCEWLSLRNDKVVLNPSEISKAIAVARAYCTKTAIEK